MWVGILFILTGDQVKCSLCHMTMKYNHSFTSNITKQLCLKHITVDLSKRQILNEDVDVPNTSELAFG